MGAVLPRLGRNAMAVLAPLVRLHCCVRCLAGEWPFRPCPGPSNGGGSYPTLPMPISVAIVAGCDQASLTGSELTAEIALLGAVRSRSAACKPVAAWTACHR